MEGCQIKKRTVYIGKSQIISFAVKFISQTTFIVNLQIKRKIRDGHTILFILGGDWLMSVSDDLLFEFFIFPWKERFIQSVGIFL